MNLPVPDSPQGGKRLTVRCYGGSMDFFFASGDLLSVDTGAKADPESIKPGDIIAYLDWADAPLVSVHRVIILLGSQEDLRFLTKGDGNLWFDPPVSVAQLVGKVTGVSRGGQSFHIGSGTGRSAGLAIAAYSYFAALLSLACRAAATAAQYPLCMAASAATALAPSFPPAAALLKGLLKAVLLADSVRREAFRSQLARLAGRIAALEGVPAGAEPSVPDGSVETVLAGEIKGKVSLAGRVLVAGDVTVLPGASLSLAPGAEVRFSRAKYGNDSALRPDGLLPLDFSDGRLCKILVYGELLCGGDGAPVRLGDGDAQWDSIIFLGRSSGVIRNTEFRGRSRPLRAMDFSRLSVEGAVSCGGPAPAFLALSGFASAGLKGSDFSGLAAPVSVEGLSRFTARDCRFTGAAAAVSAGGLSVCRLYRCAFSGSTSEALRLYGGARAALSRCSASGGASFCSCSGKSSLALRGCGLSGLSGTAALFYGRSLALRGCRVNGGARGVFFSGRRLKAVSSEFSGNTATALEAVSGDADWRNCRFETNLAAAAVFAGRSLTMGGCRFSGNAKGLVFSGERLEASSSEFSGNSAAALEAVFGTASLEDCRFETNSGGAALAFSGRRLEALRCAALANQSGFDITRGDAAISDSDFSRNSGAAVAFSGGRLEALRCGAAGNGEGFIVSGGDCAVSDSSFTGNAGAALVFSGRRLDALRCRAEENGRGFLCSGEEAAVSATSFSGNAAASLETDSGSLMAEECSFCGGPEALRAGRGARAALSSSRVEGARECAVTASGPGTAVSLSEVKIERCRRGVHASGGGVSASDSTITDSSERGLYAEKNGALDWRGGEISRSAAQGVRLESGSVLRLRGTALTGNADGISSADSAVTLSGAVFSGNSGSAISLTGGDHELADCVLENGGSGLGVYGGAYCAAQRLAVSGTGAEAVDLSSGRLRVSALSVKNCAGGITAGAGGVLEAEVLELEGAASHGIQLRDGARLLVKGGKISSCGACAVFASGPCEAQIDSFEISGCRDGITADGGGTVVRATSIEDIGGACLSCSGGRLEADGLRLRRARTGLALHKGSSSAVSLSEIADMEAGLEATGGSVCSLSGASIRSCARGAWLQDGARAEFSGCFVENSSEAGIYADAAVLSAEKTTFGHNNMAIFADRGSDVRIKDCGFSGNRTGIKADNSSGVNASGSALSGSEWDAVWCAGGARLELRGNTFSSNRYGIKEDGPCSVDSADNSFSGSGEADHLAWPRV
jgi:signal peptidase I